MAGTPPRPDDRGVDDLLPAVYAELRAVADRLLRRAGPHPTLQPTELLHEAFLRLRGAAAPLRFAGEQHLRRTAVRTMRHVLVDRARARAADKRGGGRARVTLDEDFAQPLDDGDSVLRVHDGIEQLRAVDAQLADLVELRFFGGLSVDETAATMALSPRSVDRLWRLARAWWLAHDGGRP